MHLAFVWTIRKEDKLWMQQTNPCFACLKAPYSIRSLGFFNFRASSTVTNLFCNLHQCSTFSLVHVDLFTNQSIRTSNDDFHCYVDWQGDKHLIWLIWELPSVCSFSGAALASCMCGKFTKRQLGTKRAFNLRTMSHLTIKVTMKIVNYLKFC